MVTPGVDVVETVTVSGGVFTFRRPTRADVRDAYRRWAAKLATSGLPAEADILNSMDGTRLLWEARLEVGLTTRRRANGEVVNHGESAPDHWWLIVRDDAGKEVRREVSFDQVLPDEFDAVTEALDAALKKKDSLTP